MVCVVSPVPSRDLSLTLPGGLTINATWPSVSPPTQLQQALQMIAQSGAAVAPFQPIFNLINLGLATVDFAKAVPQLIVDPSAVLEALEKLIEAAARVAQVAPPLSIPSLVVGLIDVLLAFLGGAVSELQEQAAFSERIEAVRHIMEETGNAALQEAIDCAESNLLARQENFQETLSSAGGFVVLINAIGAILSLPAVPGLDGSSLAALENTIKVIQGVRDAIPI